MQKSTVQKLALVAGLSIASTGALASTSDPCQSVFDYLQPYVGTSSYASTLAYQQAQHPYCFATSVPSTTNQTITATSFGQMAAISQGIGSRLLAGGPTKIASIGATGLAAGGGAGEWNAWGSYANDASAYKTGVAAPLNFDITNSVDNAIIGGDYRLSPTMILGLSAAFDKGSGRNNRGIAGVTNTASRGQSVAAYVGWQIDNNWAVDATVGGGVGVADTAPRTTADSSRRFAGANLSYVRWTGDWQWSGKAGYQFGSEEFDNVRRAGTALPLTYYTARLGQAKLGAEVGYWVSDGIMPFAGVTYVNDVSRNTARNANLWDDDAVALTAGINFFSLKNNLTGGVVYTDETNRKFIRHNNWMANINYRF